MQVAATHSHLNGLEWLMVHCAPLWAEINDSIEAVDADSCKTKVSKEKTMLGKLLYSPKDMNMALEEQFLSRGWSQPKRSPYWVTDDANLLRRTLLLPPDEQRQILEAEGKSPYYSFEEVDFMKGNVAVEVQFGKYFSLAWDLFVRHLHFYNTDQIEVGVEIVPMKTLQQEMSSGPGYYEQMLGALARHGKATPPMPLVLIGLSQ